jgi:hsp70-interacting protein
LIVAVLTYAFSDPNLNIRKKAVFLLTSLLHPTETTGSTSSSSNPENMHTPSQIHHPNSHTANLVDPSRTETSPVTFQSVQNHGIASDVVRAVTTSMPHGPDGDLPPDADYEEKAVSFLFAYLVECAGKLSEEDRTALKSWLEQEVAKGDLDGKWGLSEGERNALLERVR